MTRQQSMSKPQSMTEPQDMTELVVGGVTCGACAARIERRLNRLDGVAASVNYATERAYITSAGGRDAAELIGVIKTTGYTAALARPADSQDDGLPASRSGQVLLRRVQVCIPLAVAVIVMSAVPAAQFRGWQWVSLLLTAPVVTWGAWPLYRVAWRGLSHAAATMDTLVPPRSAGLCTLCCSGVRAISACGCSSR
jgi:P-type Cu+ transporter